MVLSVSVSPSVAENFSMKLIFEVFEPSEFSEFLNKTIFPFAIVG